MTTTRADAQGRLFEDLASALATILQNMAGERPAVQWETIPHVPDDATLRWRATFAGLAGAAWVAAAEPDWSAIAGHVMRAAGIDPTDARSLKSTFLGIAGQAIAGIDAALSLRLKREAAHAGGEETAEPPGPAVWIRLELKLSAATAALVMGFENPLLDALFPSADFPPALAPPPTSTREKSSTFDLLLEVELPVAVSFGRAQLQLKDVLKLTTGSIIELNRTVAEPVEVIVNNCVIARGEVVVIEGNFGVRIQHVISREERLRTLH